jgi:tRNA uridine 5-carboxymethylaminomethyl modification enzyme
MTYATLPSRNPSLTEEIALQVEIAVKYEGYIARQLAEVNRLKVMEDSKIPDGFVYAAVNGLRTEARLKLEKIRPSTLGQAGRISGVGPADLGILMIELRRVHSKSITPAPDTICCAAVENLEDPGGHDRCCGDL